MEITISGKDKNLLKQVEDLAKKLGLRISKQEKAKAIDYKERSEEIYQLMEEMAAVNAFSSIKDPVAWQREQRKDRPLPGRTES